MRYWDLKIHIITLSLFDPLPPTHTHLHCLEEALVDDTLDVRVGQREDVVQALVPGLQYRSGQYKSSGAVRGCGSGTGSRPAVQQIQAVRILSMYAGPRGRWGTNEGLRCSPTQPS